MCGSTENIVIHHNNGFSNDLEDLVVCCKKCHAKLENFQRNSKTFPLEKEKEIKKDIDKDIETDREIENSITQPIKKDFDLFSTDFSTFVDKREEMKRKLLGGNLGKGVVFLSQDQMDDLLDKLSIEEFDHYVGVVADCILKGKPYKKKTHYQAILDMAAADRMIR